MASYDYKIAKDILSEVEKNRLLCIHLNRRQDGSIDWGKAAADFDCKSVNSMKVSVGNIYKKIENAGGKVDAFGAASTPKAIPAKKRKTSKADDDDDDDDDGEEATPKKKGRKSKAMKEKEQSADEDAAATGDILKDEPVDEGDADA